MTKTRWRKVAADLWGNKTRTILTILTITVGVFTIGFAIGMRGILLPDTDATYAAANPHSAILYTTPFEDQALQYAQDVPGVTKVDGRASIVVRLIASEERKLDLSIDGIVPPSGMHVSLLQPVEPGELPPLNDDEIWIERSSLDIFPVQVGETVRVQLSAGQVRELRVAAVVRDASMPSAVFSSALAAFATPATVESLGGVSSYDKLLVVVDNHTQDKDRVDMVVGAVSERLRENGVMVLGTWVYNPGEHFSRQIAVGVMTVLDVLGGLAVLLSTFLVINTINSLLGQHVRHIGIMKAVGGRGSQIAGMYFIFILTCGLLALAIALPAGALAAYGACVGMASFINIGLRGFRVVPQAAVGQALTALLVPLVAAAVPVFTGTRISVREAIGDYGVGRSDSGRGRINRLLERVRFLPRPTLLSLRNAFRRKGRLALTLSTLILGGAIFIAVFNLGKSSEVMVNDVKGYFLADINVTFAQPYAMDEIERLVPDVPEVIAVEGWGSAEAQILSDNGTDSKRIAFVAPPSDSALIDPVLVEGRWLQPGDEKALVIGNHLLAVRPDLGVGDTVVIQIAGQETTWEIVGIFKLVGNVEPPLVYTNNETLERYMPERGTVTSIRVTTAGSDAETQWRVSQALEKALNQENIRFSQIIVSSDWLAQQSSAFNVLIYFLLVMAVLIAVVGGLGLTGTMSLNVMERTREIGVLRAVGASDGGVLRMVIVEGVIVGMISWLLALGLSFPLTLALDASVGQVMFNQVMTFAVGWQGMSYWLIGVLVLATLASALPAWRAVRLTVRDVLAYE